MTAEQTALALAGASGVITSILIETLNRATPGHKFNPKILQAVAFTLAAVAVVGYSIATAGPAGADWNTVVPAVFAAWAVALAAHDVVSPRT